MYDHETQRDSDSASDGDSKVPCVHLYERRSRRQLTPPSCLIHIHKVVDPPTFLTFLLHVPDTVALIAAEHTTMHTNTLGPLLTTTLGIIFLILRPWLFPRRYTLYFSVHAFDNSYHSGEPDFRVQLARGSGDGRADADGDKWDSELNWAYGDDQLGRPVKEVFRVRSEDGRIALVSTACSACRLTSSGSIELYDGLADDQCTIAGTYPLDYNIWAFNTDSDGRITLDLCGCMDDGQGRGLSVRCSSIAHPGDVESITCLASSSMDTC